MRDHMMGWAIPAEPLGPAIRPLVASKAACEKLNAEMAVHDFETGDHMLPGMKQSDFPKEYDTRVAIEDRFSAAYDRALREMAENMAFSRPIVFGYDAGALGGDMTVVTKADRQAILNNDWGASSVRHPHYLETQRLRNEASQRLMDEMCGVSKYQFDPTSAPPKTASGLRFLQEHAEMTRVCGVGRIDWTAVVR